MRNLKRCRRAAQATTFAQTECTLRDTRELTETQRRVLALEQILPKKNADVVQRFHDLKQSIASDDQSVSCARVFASNGRAHIERLEAQVEDQCRAVPGRRA